MFELLRGLSWAATSCFVAARTPGGLTARHVATSTAQGITSSCLVLLLLELTYDADPAVSRLLRRVDTTPRVLRPVRDAVVSFGRRKRAELFGGRPLVDAHLAVVYAITTIIFLISAC